MGWNANGFAIACSEPQIKDVLRLLLCNVKKGAPLTWSKGDGEEVIDFDFGALDTVEKLGKALDDYYYLYAGCALDPQSVRPIASDEPWFSLDRRGEVWVIDFGYYTTKGFAADDLEDFVQMLPDGLYAIADVHSYDDDDCVYYEFGGLGREDGLTRGGSHDDMDDPDESFWKDDEGCPRDEFVQICEEIIENGGDDPVSLSRIAAIKRYDILEPLGVFE